MPYPPLPRSPFFTAIASLCAVGLLLTAAFPAHTLAAELLELQNRRDTPIQPTPGQTTPVEPVPAGRAPSGPGIIVVPTPRPPQVAVPEARTPQTATPPVVAVPYEPAQPAQPETPPARAPEPARAEPVTPAAPVVVVPSAPEKAPAGDPEKTDVPLTPESVLLTAPEPEKEDTTLFTPERFLLTTPEPEKKPAAPEEKTPAQAEKKPQEPPRKEPAPKPGEKKPEAGKPEKAEAPQKGDPLTIPERARQTGELDFLEGCWVGTRPEYHTKRIVTERFCFGKDGTGKRFIEDPAEAGQCVGATRALMNQGGVLRMQSDKMYCSNTPENWGASEMTCRGEGEQTPCTWVFTDAGGGRQSYTIRFVRE